MCTSQLSTINKQKLEANSITNERVVRAKDEICNVTEEYIINNKKFDENNFRDLLNSIARKYDIDSILTYNYVSMLEDVVLRLQISRHINIDQKSKFTEDIRSMIIMYENSILKRIGKSNNEDVQSDDEILKIKKDNEFLVMQIKSLERKNSYIKRWYYCF